MRETIASGKTVEEATEKGCLELGLCREDVRVEILEMPVRRLFKTTPAKVKVTADTREDEPAPKAPQASTAPTAAAAPTPGQGRQAQAQAAAHQATATENRHSAQAPSLLPEEPEEELDLAKDKSAAKAAEYLLSILSAMGANDVKLCALKQGDATLIRVEGESIGEKMEVRGEVVQALSYLIDRAVNTGVDKKEEGYLRLRLDVAGYRNRRESELISLAQRTARDVVRTRRSRTLAPMNPYERLIVHTTISKIPGVSSESIGADVERRVVVKSTAAPATPGEDSRGTQRGPRGGKRPQQGGPRQGGPRQGGAGQKPRGGYGASTTPEREYADKPKDPAAAPVVPQRREAIKDADDVPLYGKVDV